MRLGMSVKMEWETGKGGCGDARVDAFLAFIVCASFGKNLCLGQLPMGLTISTGRLSD